MKLDVQGQGGGRILDVDGQGGVVRLENWTIFMHVICVSSLSYLSSKDFDLNLVFLVCDIPCLN